MHQSKNSVANLLRSETAHEHHRLESTSKMSRLMSDDILIFEYLAILQKIYRIVGSLGRVLSLHPKWSENFQGLVRVKEERLKEDLRFLGADNRLDPISEDRLPVSRESSLAECFGAWYVVEGSGFGGQFLYRKLHQTLGLTKETGASYFYGEGAQTAEKWKQFICDLEEVPHNSKELKAMVIAANRTFCLYGEEL